MPERQLLHLNSPDGKQGTLARLDGDQLLDIRPLTLAAPDAPGDGDSPAPTPPIGTAPLDILLPASWCNLLWVSIPTRQRAQAIKALPYAVEEQLATDIDTLQLTLGPKPDLDNRWPVLAVDRHAREALLEQLAALRIKPARLLCELDVVPDFDTTTDTSLPAWQILPLPDHCLLRTGPHAGFAIPGHDLGDWLEAMDTPAEQPLELHIPADNQAMAQRCLESLKGWEAVHSRQHDKGWLALLAEGSLRGQPLNAWQPPPDQRARQALRNWSVAAAIALLLVGTLTIDQAMQTRAAQAENQALEAKVERLFRQALPEVQRMVNPRVQIEQALAGHGHQESGSDLLTLLHALGEAMQPAQQRLQLERLDFANQRLEVSVRAGDYAQIESLLERLRSHDELRVGLAGSRAAEGQSEARIEIRQGGGA